VGDGIKLAGVPRESLFLTTKINNMNHKHVAETMEESLHKLQTDYVDLVLMHWPVSIGMSCGFHSRKRITYIIHYSDPAGEKQTLVYKDWKFTDTWREMEKLVESGKARSIGVSNFGIRNLETLLASARIVPAVCQVELHPQCPSTKLVDFCKRKGIHFAAYCCLGSSNSPLAEDKTVRSIADAHGRTVQQVLLVWGLKRGTSVIPKSTADARIRSNFDLNGLDLTEEEMKKLNSLPDRFKAVGKEWLPEKVFSSDEEGRDFYDGDKLFQEKEENKHQ
jgi:glycerol 2-dehydrogenase (NADP+)